jgi:hypothetical protein
LEGILGFWSALLLRLLAGIGWAGTYMPASRRFAGPLEGTAQSRALRTKELARPGWDRCS